MKRFARLKLLFVFLNVFPSFSKVDVAIIEVGIGGEFDCTNIIKFVSLWFSFN
jgi:folylpolyglutamate synthase/dihydropteroate synthase